MHRHHVRAEAGDAYGGEGGSLGQVGQPLLPMAHQVASDGVIHRHRVIAPHLKDRMTAQLQVDHEPATCLTHTRYDAHELHVPLLGIERTCVASMCEAPAGAMDVPMIGLMCS